MICPDCNTQMEVIHDDWEIDEYGMKHQVNLVWKCPKCNIEILEDEDHNII